MFRFVLVVSLWGQGLLWAGGQEPASPNIVWINCEDLDPWIGAYGHPLADTPHLDGFAKEAYRFDNAFATAPICAPSRSTLITGRYATSLGSQHLRCEITLPDSVIPFPRRLSALGYFTTNYAKTDFNFSPDGVFDYWRRDEAPWRARSHPNMPFFSYFVLGATHEGPGNFRDRYEAAVSALPPERRHDPSAVSVPGYYPDTPKLRELLARYHDLVSALDLQVGEIFAQLQSDGLWEDTIVWFFSDHGTGLPRHKRWLLDSGIRVPLMVRIPEKYRHLAPTEWRVGGGVGELVSFVDFAPTVLRLAGARKDPKGQGRAFLGAAPEPAPPYVFGARDRADDLFECSRAAHDGRFVYVRHFMPHLPWIRAGRIMGDQKESFAELRRARDEDGWSVDAGLWARRKPVEELYDTWADPDEMVNLATDPAYGPRRDAMRTALKEWMLTSRDTGLLAESEYHRRAEAAERAIADWAADDRRFPVAEILEAAWRVSADAEGVDWLGFLENPEPGVRYWGALGAQMAPRAPDQRGMAALRARLEDPSPSVAIAAAQALALWGGSDVEPLRALARWASDDRMRVALEAARALVEVGQAAAPVAEAMERARVRLEGGEGGRRYRDFNYASFTGWALETALIQVGAAREEDFKD